MLGSQTEAMMNASQTLAAAARCSPPFYPLFRHTAARAWPCSCAKSVQRMQHAVAAAGAPPATAAAPASSPTPLQTVSWPGLHQWRASEVDKRTVWGPKGPVEPPNSVLATGTAAGQEMAAAPLPPTLAQCGRAVLLTPDPLSKAALTFAAFRAYKEGSLPIGTAEAVDGPPARPSKPELVPPRQIPSMEKSPLPKAVYMLHNLAHVELNAIDLAWDTLVRFSALHLPEQFYADFARVADDESRHLSWCLQRLEELGYFYGCMSAHNILWEGSQMSSHDLGARLAIVPMSQEARGLDAGDRLSKRLVGLGDNRTAAIVRRIATEERAHVAVGVTWFSHICAALDLEPGPSFRQVVLELCPGLLKGPFNDAERQLVGLPPDFYSTALWSPELRSAAAEAMTAAERGSPPQPASPGGNSAAIAPLSDAAQLRRLAARLGAMLDLEAAASSPV